MKYKRDSLACTGKFSKKAVNNERQKFQRNWELGQKKTDKEKLYNKKEDHEL